MQIVKTLSLKNKFFYPSLFFKKLALNLKFLSVKIILFLKGVKIKIVKDPEVLKQIFKIRKNVYEEKKYLNFDKNCEIWSDEYDKCAINIGAFKKGRVIGAVRILTPQKLCFPIENYFNLRKKIPNNCVEISKLVISNNFRGGKRFILIGLMKKALDWSLKNQFNYWIFFTPKKLADSFKKMKINFVEFKTNGLTEKESSNRNQMSGYFKQDIRAYFLDLNQV